MAEVKKVIESVGSDGKIVLSNILDKVTGEYITYKEVDKFYDGSAMDDSKCDGSIYRKYKGRYVVRVLTNSGKYLEKDTMSSMRDLTESEILLLKMGYYRGVRLSGYYSENDFGESVVYSITDLVSDDDGGSFIKVNDTVFLKTSFIDSVNVINFGAKNNAGRYKINTVSGSPVVTYTSSVFKPSLIGSEVNITNIMDTEDYYSLKANVVSVGSDGKSITLDDSIPFNATGAIMFTNRFDSGVAIQNAGNYAVKHNLGMLIPSGNYYIKTAFDINGNPSGGYRDDLQRVEFKIDTKDVNIYYDNELSYSGPSLSVLGFTQISHVVLRGISIKGWNNNYKWFNYGNANNVPSPSPTNQPYFRIMGFDRLVIEGCNFEDMGGSIAIMGADQSSTTVSPNTYIKTEGLVFTNNRVSNCWQFSITRGRGRDYIMTNNLFEYVSHKYYSNINHVGNHIWTNNIFKNCPRLLFGINDGLVFSNNVLDCVLAGIELQGFSHVNYYDYGKKNILISNNVFNNTKGGMQTLIASNDHLSGEVTVYGKNVLKISNPVQYQATGTAKFKAIMFSNNIVDLSDSLSNNDALFTIENQDLEIEDISISNNNITSNKVGEGSPAKTVLNVGQPKVSRLFNFSGNVVRGLRPSNFALDLRELLMPGATAKVNGNYFHDEDFNYPIISMIRGKLEFKDNSVNMSDFSSNNIGLLYLTTPKVVYAINNSIKTVGNNQRGCIVFIQPSASGENDGIVIRANGNNFNLIDNVIKDASVYLTNGGMVEAIGNVGMFNDPIANNSSSRVRNLWNPTYSGNTPPIDSNLVSTGYVVYCWSEGSDGTYGFLKMSDKSWKPLK